MKKLTAILLVLVLALTTVAAFATESKTVDDLNKSTTTKTTTTKKTTTTSTTREEEEEDEAFLLWVTKEAALVEKANEEIAKLKDAGVAEYFGKADEIAAILGEGEYDVHEFWPVRAIHSELVKGSATVELTFATPYEKDAKVALLIGLANGESIAWTVLEGTVADDNGTVTFSVSADLAKQIEENTALLAVVSK